MEKLIWDEWNRQHIARHEVIPEEVEQALKGFFTVRQSYKARLYLVGQTEQQRILAVVLDPLEAGNFYPITAHTADRKERRIYQLALQKHFEEAA